jgi:predicted nucleic-acid-binding protein
MERIKKHKDFLKQLFESKDNKRERVRQIKNAKKSEICTICEIVKNLLHNPSLSIKLTPEQRHTLKLFSKNLRALVDRKVSIERKKNILHRGRGFLLPIIASLVGPVLSKLLQ